MTEKEIKTAMMELVKLSQAFSPNSRIGKLADELWAECWREVNDDSDYLRDPNAE